MNINKVFDVNSSIDIERIMYDSRKDCANSIFFAIKGKINDGHKFIDMAISNGAICIVHSDEIKDKKQGILYIQREDVMDAYVSFCRIYYGDPCSKLNVMGITGTNGKTTISWIIRSIIANFNKCGYIGTMGYYYGEEINDSSLNLTTPKSDELFRICKEMLDYGCTSLVLEASSEGLSTHRLDQIHFSTAVFNNLSSEHMDVHKTMDNYFNSKTILFERCDKAIINIDDEYGQKLMSISKANNITYGIEKECDYQAINLNLFNDHSEFDLLYKGKTYHINTNMVAKFNVYNLLAVIAVLNENGYKIENILPYLSNVELCPGRCDLVKCGQDFNVVVDYAFTPNSFDKVFNFAESITPKGNKIYAVFGAAGDRDHMRRPGTAKIADERADYVILSYDDPATEDMNEICLDLKSYFKRLNPEIILDRYKAIEKVVNMANKGDTILLLGKGNDEFFLDKNGRIPWMSDKVAAQKAIKNK